MDRTGRKQLAERLRFTHFIPKSSLGRVTIAWTRLPDSKMVYWAASACHPNDQFTKERGRNYSRQRLFTSMRLYGKTQPASWKDSGIDLAGSIQLKEASIPVKDIVLLLIDEVERDSCYPQWAKDPDFKVTVSWRY